MKIIKISIMSCLVLFIAGCTKENPQVPESGIHSIQDVTNIQEEINIAACIDMKLINSYKDLLIYSCGEELRVYNLVSEKYLKKFHLAKTNAIRFQGLAVSPSLSKLTYYSVGDKKNDRYSQYDLYIIDLETLQEKKVFSGFNHGDPIYWINENTLIIEDKQINEDQISWKVVEIDTGAHQSLDLTEVGKFEVSKTPLHIFRLRPQSNLQNYAYIRGFGDFELLVLYLNGFHYIVEVSGGIGKITWSQHGKYLIYERGGASGGELSGLFVVNTRAQHYYPYEDFMKIYQEDIPRSRALALNDKFDCSKTASERCSTSFERWLDNERFLFRKLTTDNHGIPQKIQFWTIDLSTEKLSLVAEFNTETSDGSSVKDPLISHDLKQIFYIKLIPSDGTKQELWLANIDGSNEKFIDKNY